MTLLIGGFRLCAFRLNETARFARGVAEALTGAPLGVCQIP